MKRLVYLLVLLLTASWTFAQKDTANIAPQSQIKVNKKYDENGNLIQYDSTYVSTWSSDSTFTTMDMDSLQNQMKFFFGDGFDSFLNDSTFFGHNSFEKMNKEFFDEHQKFLNQFGMADNDSLMKSMPGIIHDFSDFDSMRKEMEDHFKKFFGTDSTHVDFKEVQ